MFYKVWWKVFGVVESEFINGFSKFWKKFVDPEKALRKRYIWKLMIFHKIWWKVFGVVESESMNGFSEFWKKFLVSW